MLYHKQKQFAKQLFISYDEFGNLLDHKGREIDDDKLDPYTLNDVRKLIASAEGQFKWILTSVVFTGMRTGEMVTLRWSDVDWENETILLSKEEITVVTRLELLNRNF
ncbi:MAG: tyrosine-type recombinase/integrase [Sulfurimonas sp.]|nr:tyrosine-type recombinase/integrase [Sulfurimonas sp.]